MELRSDKRQKTRNERDSVSTGAGEAQHRRQRESESLPAIHEDESPTSMDRIMEEICEWGNLKEAIGQVKANKGSAGIDGRTVDELPRLPRIGGHSGTVIGWDLYTATGETGGNSEARRRGAQAGHPDGGRPVCAASGDASSAKALGPDLLREQLWIPAGSVHSSGCGAGAAIYGCRLRLGG